MLCFHKLTCENTNKKQRFVNTRNCQIAGEHQATSEGVFVIKFDVKAYFFPQN